MYKSCVFSRLIVVNLFLISLFGCSETTSSTQDLLVSGGRIVGRTSSGLARRSALALSTEDLMAKGRSFCSAVLISEQIALTAAHCVTTDYKKISDEKIIAVHGVNVRNGEPLAVRSIAVHRDYQPDALIRDDLGPMHDLAILLLLPSKNRQIKPASLAPKSLGIAKGSKLKIAGYGVTRSRADDDTGSLRQVSMTLDTADAKQSLLMLIGPLRQGYSREPSSEGRERIVRVRAGACAGDSGGPAYLESRQDSYVVGITSFGKELPSLNPNDDSEICVGENGYTDVRPYAPTVRRVMTKLKQQRDPRSHYWFDSQGQLLSAD